MKRAHSPPSPRHQAHSARSAGHPCLGCGSLFHIQSHTHTPKKHSHSKSALAISPQSSTKIKIGRNTQLHTHTHTNARRSQWSSGNRITCLSDCSVPAERHSSDPATVTHTLEQGRRLWLLLHPSGTSASLVLPDGKEGTLTHDTDEVTILKPLANKEEEGRLGPFHMYTGISGNDAFLLMCFNPLYTCSILGH